MHNNLDALLRRKLGEDTMKDKTDFSWWTDILEAKTRQGLH